MGKAWLESCTDGYCKFLESFCRELKIVVGWNFFEWNNSASLHLTQRDDIAPPMYCLPVLQQSIPTIQVFVVVLIHYYYQKNKTGNTVRIENQLLNHKAEQGNTSLSKLNLRRR